MRDLLILLVHLITTTARLMGPGGAGSVIAESLLASAGETPRLCRGGTQSLTIPGVE